MGDPSKNSAALIGAMVDTAPLGTLADVAAWLSKLSQVLRSGGNRVAGYVAEDAVTVIAGVTEQEEGFVEMYGFGVSQFAEEVEDMKSDLAAAEEEAREQDAKIEGLGDRIEGLVEQVDRLKEEAAKGATP